MNIRQKYAISGIIDSINGELDLLPDREIYEVLVEVKSDIERMIELQENTTQEGGK